MSSAHDHRPHVDTTGRNVRLGDGASQLQMTLLAVGLGGVVIAALIGWFGWMGVDETFFWKSYLQNFMFVLAIALGALFFVFIQHLTKAGWSVAIRRPAEVLASNLRWIWILFLPIVVLFLRGKAGVVFPWADMTTLAANHPDEATLVSHKLGYLNPTFFWIRAAVYFGVWAFLATYFLRGSLRVGESGDITTVRRMQRMAAPAAPLFGLSITFASIDWMMSIAPAWFSTMFGVYFFAGCCTVGFAALAIVCVRLRAAGTLDGVITTEHFQDLGKLLFAFGMVFWAYIAYSQYMLIWYGNIPEETGWYIARQLGDWKWLSLALLFGHFLIPFLGLISRWPKRMPAVLALAATWMLLFGWLDLYWLVMPEIPHDLASFATYGEVATKYAHEATRLANPLNWIMLVGLGGLFGAATVATLRKHDLLCARDPRLPESIRFENF